MISGQLGSSQLGLAQLGSYDQLLMPNSVPPTPGPSVVYIDGSTLNYIVLPDYFKMMGIEVC
jgi:hypothetical protein